jgi:hypothetical protein
MNNVGSVSTRSVIILRWLARIVGTLAMVGFLLLFVADCVTKGRIAIESDRILMTAFMLLAFIGLGIAWKREGIGGATALVGLVGFTLFAPASLSGGAVLVIAGVYGLPALLFLYCWFRTREPIHPRAT